MEEDAWPMESEDSDLDAYTMLKREIEESLRHILESEAADPSSCDLHFTLNSPKNNAQTPRRGVSEFKYGQDSESQHELESLRTELKESNKLNVRLRNLLAQSEEKNALYEAIVNNSKSKRDRQEDAKHFKAEEELDTSITSNSVPSEDGKIKEETEMLQALKEDVANQSAQISRLLELLAIKSKEGRERRDGEEKTANIILGLKQSIESLMEPKNSAGAMLGRDPQVLQQTLSFLEQKEEKIEALSTELSQLKEELLRRENEGNETAITHQVEVKTLNDRINALIARQQDKEEEATFLDFSPLTKAAYDKENCHKGPTNKNLDIGDLKSPGPNEEISCELQRAGNDENRQCKTGFAREVEESVEETERSHRLSCFERAETQGTLAITGLLDLSITEQGYEGGVEGFDHLILHELDSTKDLLNFLEAHTEEDMIESSGQGQRSKVDEIASITKEAFELVPETFDKKEEAMTEDKEADISDPHASGSSGDEKKDGSHKSSCEAKFESLLSYFQEVEGHEDVFLSKGEEEYHSSMEERDNKFRTQLSSLISAAEKMRLLAAKSDALSQAPEKECQALRSQLSQSQRVSLAAIKIFVLCFLAIIAAPDVFRGLIRQVIQLPLLLCKDTGEVIM